MRGPIVVVAVVAALVASPPPAQADDARELQARSHFAIGQGRYRLGQYAEAIEAFQAGYRLKPLPLFLFNIAQAARKSGRFEMATDYYVQYLEREPLRTAPQRAEAESWVMKLRRALAESRGRGRSVPVGSVGKSGAKEALADDEPPAAVARPLLPTPAASAASPPSPTMTAPLPPSATTSATAAPPRRPLWKRGWFWGTLAAVAVVGAGVGVGTWLALETRGPTPPSLGSVQF